MYHHSRMFHRLQRKVVLYVYCNCCASDSEFALLELPRSDHLACCVSTPFWPRHHYEGLKQLHLQMASWPCVHKKC